MDSAVPGQIAVIHGQVLPFDGDFRKALEAVDDFVRALSLSEGISDVEVLSMPLDVSSAVSLTGDVGASLGPGTARFSIKMTFSHGAG